jgi:hypothetical protein
MSLTATQNYIKRVGEGLVQFCIQTDRLIHHGKPARRRASNFSSITNYWSFVTFSRCGSF